MKENKTFTQIWDEIHMKVEELFTYKGEEPTLKVYDDGSWSIEGAIEADEDLKSKGFDLCKATVEHGNSLKSLEELLNIKLT